MPLLILAPLIVVALLLLIPLSLVQRYRMGTTRQRARGWLVAINVAGLALSILFFVAGAAFTTLWVAGTLTYALAGLAAGMLLGMVGVWLTRWERVGGTLHYTPNRWLVLALTLTITARLLYGVWRGWQAWGAGVQGESWFVAAGVPGSMAAGAVVLGYYFVFWLGVRQKINP